MGFLGQHDRHHRQTGTGKDDLIVLHFAGGGTAHQIGQAVFFRMSHSQ